MIDISKNKKIISELKEEITILETESKQIRVTLNKINDSLNEKKELLKRYSTDYNVEELYGKYVVDINCCSHGFSREYMFIKGPSSTFITSKENKSISLSVEGCFIKRYDYNTDTIRYQDNPIYSLSTPVRYLLTWEFITKEEYEVEKRLMEMYMKDVEWREKKEREEKRQSCYKRYGF